MNVYPVFLNDLHQRRCVVFGGNHEAERKVQRLLDCGADVTVVDPTATETLARWASEGRLRWTRRRYRPGDLKGVFLAIVAETNPPRTAPIWREAQEENVLLNAMDDVPHCSFVAGSVVRRGPLVISISTSGCAPALSVRIREKLETLFGPEYGSLLELLGGLRDEMVARFPDFNERRRRWYDLVDSDLLDLLKADQAESARQRTEDLLH